MKIKENIKNFYDQEAEKYYFTRKKYRADWYMILEEIEKSWKDKISILEFWCGSWRLISFLNQNLKNKEIKYIWVDLSKELLNFAKKDNPKNKFIQDDISNYIKTTKQESIDFIIWIASFQHIWDNDTRKFLIKNFYKSLRYWWKLIMINRSISEWFIKKHMKVIIKSIFKYIYTIWYSNWNDLYIPRQNKNIKLYRFYHIFTINELLKLTKLWWFKINKLTYIDRCWQNTSDRKKSKNTIFIWSKDI